MGEVKRVFHKKMWILIAVAVLGNLCLFLYSELAGRSFTEMFFAAGQYQKLVERYENMSLEQAQERLGTEFSNIRKYAKILKQENSQEETKILLKMKYRTVRRQKMRYRSRHRKNFYRKSMKAVVK